MLIKNEAVKVHNANAETEDVFDEDDDQKANEKHKKEPPTSFQKLKEKLKKEKMRSSTVPCPIEKDANDHSD
ncbi:hypothetical protein, partial [Acinetobacter baumannii]